MLHLSCNRTSILYVVFVMSLFLILQNLPHYLTLNMLMCRMYFIELQAACPCCTLNTIIYLKKWGIFLMQSSISISKNSGEVTLLHIPFSGRFKTMFLNAHTYVFVILYVNKKAYGWNLHFITTVKPTIHLSRTSGTSKPLAHAEEPLILITKPGSLPGILSCFQASMVLGI